MIEVRQLQTLIALAETGSLSAAARRVNLTQSALSHQIKQLEDEVGCSLFQRKSIPLRWTPVGERMVALAYDVQRAIQDAHRDAAKLLQGSAGECRIAVECHSCFDWLMPAMDAFRDHWPEVELDLVSGFHPDPVGLLEENRADVVIVSRRAERGDLVYHPLFRYRMPALLAKGHALTHKRYLTAHDFAQQTLITYPIPDERLDLVRRVLQPAGVNPARRTATLTEAILQLVASRRGITALPAWAVQPYLAREYVVARPVTTTGLWCELFAVTTDTAAQAAYMQDFIATMLKICFQRLDGIDPF